MRRNGLGGRHYSRNHLGAGCIGLRAGAAFGQPQPGGDKKVKSDSLHVRDDFRLDQNSKSRTISAGVFLLRPANAAVIFGHATRLSFTNPTS